MKIKQQSDKWQVTGDKNARSGIALVITLIMLSVTLVMAVAFLALAKRERGSVSTSTDTTVARLAAGTAVANAQAQIVAGILSSLTNGSSSNAYNLHLFVSTNYINPSGFTSGNGSPTNVNYYYANGNMVSAADFVQNVANLWYLPRAPVMVSPTEPVGRFYLDLNENGSFDPNGWQPVISDNPALPYYDLNGNLEATYNPPNVLSNFFVGDPEWVGVLEHPDAPHSANNRFISRYAFFAVPAGNALDFNYLHNAALNPVNPTLTTSDGFSRNQGVGSWEINLAAFLADLNTNVWSPLPLPANNYYAYNEPNNQWNSGHAFDDARALLAYRYQYTSLPSAANLFDYTPLQLAAFRASGIDNYSRGPLQTNLDYNRTLLAPPLATVTMLPWSGADNVNHFFTPSDLLDGTKLPSGPNTFIGRLAYGGATNYVANGQTLKPTYDRYTFYRMLDQLGSDSSPDDGRLNLNYSNAVVSYNKYNLPTSIGIIAGAETNLTRWTPLNFFHAAADQMLRLYTSNWWSTSYQAFTNNYAVTAPFTVTNIPVWVSNRFVYTPAVHRLLQLAANIYDATTNGNNNFPHVFKPVFERVNNNGDIFIAGYVQVTNVVPPVNGVNRDAQLTQPMDITQLAGPGPVNAPIVNTLNVPLNGGLVNVYGVPWIIGAKKGLPGFNQLSVVNSSQVTRRLQVSRPTYGARVNTTNQMYLISITNQVGVSFWNSYASNYKSRTGQGLTLYASAWTSLNFSNSSYSGNSLLQFYNRNYYQTISANSYWPGANLASTPNGSPNPYSFYGTNSAIAYLPLDIYSLNSSTPGRLLPYSASQQWDPTYPLRPLNYYGNLGLATTNYLQAYILDGNNVIDYVQFRDPQGFTNLDLAMRDPGNGDQGYLPNRYYLWETNGYGGQAMPTMGVVNQIAVSENYNSVNQIAPNTGNNNNALYGTYDKSSASLFQSFMSPRWLGPGLLTHQAPYTPSRTVYSPYLMQANDPLVHYLASDMMSAPNYNLAWQNNPYLNGLWQRSDDPTSQGLPAVPIYGPAVTGGRYQPWGRQNGQMSVVGPVDANPFNLAYRDPGILSADYWDFPTNMYPSVGWIGRVHRGTPWQTVYLKSTNIVGTSSSSTINGSQTWATWTGNLTRNAFWPYNSQYFDAYNSSPQQDYLLFDIFTTRVNDNSVRGTLPVNAGMGRPDGSLTAWSALFSGMVAISNSAARPIWGSSPTYASQIINPVGVDAANSPLWQIVNGPYGINATRTNTYWFPYQSFNHVGQILATPALSTYSPFLDLGGPPVRGSSGAVVGTQQTCYGINDEEYEWLPQQMMGLVRGTEQRYVLYCYGQTLRPAPGGTVLTSGKFFQLVTNYQVVAESVLRAVIRVDNANTVQPHVVVESYNVLPPN